MKKKKKEQHFIKQVKYKGGNKALKAKVASLLQYPEEAQKARIGGTVFLKFDIDYKGNTENIQVVSGIGYGCDQEAIRVISLLKYETPKTPKKLKVVYHKTMNIHFNHHVQAESTVEYQVTQVPNSKPSALTKPSKPSSYTYTIEW